MDMEISFPGGKVVAAHYNGYEFVTDQPEAGGGQGTAPSPFDFFLASMGTCAGYYVLNFCYTRNLPTEGIKLRQRWERHPQTRLIELIHQDILLPTDFPEKYLTAVVRAAEQCTVKKHLENPPQVIIQAMRGDG